MKVFIVRVREHFTIKPESKKGFAFASPFFVSIGFLILKKLFYLCSDILDLLGWFEAGNNLSLFVSQELCEVPFDFCALFVIRISF